jgi:hypothetical protein
MRSGMVSEQVITQSYSDGTTPGSVPAATGPARWRLGTSRRRAVAGWSAAIAGLAAYNWWLLVPLKPGLMTSPDELFSNLEVSGQPYASIMQHCDLLSGVLLLAAFLVLGPGGRARIRDWLAMLGFAVAGALGGLFPEVCADGINATCRREEWHFQLPLSQYVHIVAGIFEFGAITIALFIALRRTRGAGPWFARSYRRLWTAALICYPLLGLAYLVNRMGGVMEAVFFTGFTVMVVTQVGERTRGAGRAGPPTAPAFREERAAATSPAGSPGR